MKRRGGTGDLSAQVERTNRTRETELQQLRADAEIAVRVCELVLQAHGVDIGECSAERLGEFARRAYGLLSKVKEEETWEKT